MIEKVQIYNGYRGVWCLYFLYMNFIHWMEAKKTGQILAPIFYHTNIISACFFMI